MAPPKPATNGAPCRCGKVIISISITIILVWLVILVHYNVEWFVGDLTMERVHVDQGLCL